MLPNQNMLIPYTYHLFSNYKAIQERAQKLEFAKSASIAVHFLYLKKDNISKNFIYAKCSPEQLALNRFLLQYKKRHQRLYMGMERMPMIDRVTLFFSRYDVQLYFLKKLFLISFLSTHDGITYINRNSEGFYSGFDQLVVADLKNGRNEKYVDVIKSLDVDLLHQRDVNYLMELTDINGFLVTSVLLFLITASGTVYSSALNKFLFVSGLSVVKQKQKCFSVFILHF